ncbi:MAG: helix-turn-helix domain-containing protein [bacterium]|nr:helix-turn-helix domain-containing protein [bacterium]
MFKENLLTLRKMNGMNQEELAEKLQVSRQTLSKWETGEAIPDIEKCRILAEIFDVSLDELVNYDGGSSGVPMPPKGKHAFGIVTVGDKGQVVIPAKARKIFDIKPGDRMFVLGDENAGLAILKEEEFLAVFQTICKK